MKPTLKLDLLVKYIMHNSIFDHNIKLPMLEYPER